MRIPLSALLLCGCAAQATLPGTPEAPLAGPGAVHGRYDVSSWTVPPGNTLLYDGDLDVVSEGDIVIAGCVQGRARPADDLTMAGADLVLESKTRIVISGLLEGAPGRSGADNPATRKLLGDDAAGFGEEQMNEALVALLARTRGEGIDLALFDGGRGGEIRLIAPEIRIERVVGGRAGHAGPTGKGGDGGSVWVTCGTKWRDESPGTFGGAAGNGGEAVAFIREGRGGDGGAGGSAGRITATASR